MFYCDKCYTVDNLIKIDLDLLEGCEDVDFFKRITGVR